MERPEHRLLLACARVCGDLERRDLILSALGGQIDWEYLLQTARTHGMTSLLFRHLNATCPDTVPKAILDRLQDHFRKSVRRNLHFTAELISILDLFTNNNLPAIPFKGPILGITLYEDPALREFNDLDILVHKQDVFRALRLLPAIGYKKIPDYSAAIEARILKQQFDYEIEKETQIGVVELHWNIMPDYFNIDLHLESWWERAESVSVQIRPVPHLSPEDLLVALCVHGCRHMWHSVPWIVDLARLLDKRPDLDWNYVASNYSHSDLQRMISVGILVAHDLLGAPLPQSELFRARQDSVATDLAREAIEMLFQSESEGGTFRLKRFQFRLKSTWAGRIGSCFRFFSTPTLADRNADLPKPLLYVYFLLRPLRLPLAYLIRLFSPKR